MPNRDGCVASARCSVQKGGAAILASLAGCALGLFVSVGGVAAAGTGTLILGELALDGISAGTATSIAEAAGFASGSERAKVEVNGDTNSTTDGKVSISSSTVIAKAFALGTGAIAETTGAASANGNASRFTKVITVQGVTPFGKMSATVAYATAVGFVP